MRKPKGQQARRASIHDPAPEEDDDGDEAEALSTTEVARKVDSRQQSHGKASIPSSAVTTESRRVSGNILPAKPHTIQ